MNKKLICFFEKGSDEGSLKYTSVDAETKEFIPEYSDVISFENVQSFFNNLPPFLKTLTKAVIFKQFFDFENPNFHDSAEFLRFLMSIFGKLDIRIRFIDGETYTLTRILVETTINPKWDKNILIILVSVDKIFVEELNRIKAGYIRPPTQGTQIFKCPAGYDPMKIKAEILRNRNPTKIFIREFEGFSPQILNDMIDIFGNDKYICCCKDKENETIVELAAHLFNEKQNRFYVFPRFTYAVKNEQEPFLYLIECDLTDDLPFKETRVDKRLSVSGKYCIEKYYQDQRKTEVLEKFPPPSSQCHGIVLTLTVSSKLTPLLEIKPFINPSIDLLPLCLTSKIDSKIPVIGFFGNSSIICVWKETEKCYKFCENWNGLFGEDLYISFDAEKPKYRNQAFAVLKEKPSFVVYDVYEVLKHGNNYPNPNWPFKVTKDEENPVLMEFDNFDGTRKFATPEFLMALLLKDHRKAIKEETGIKPSEIGFAFFDDKNESELTDYSMLKRRIKASCDLLKIGCKIFDHDDDMILL